MGEADARTRAAYDRTPDLEWARLTKSLHARFEHEVTTHACGRHLPPAPARLLDAGGGPGRYTIDLASQGYLVTLVDLNPAYLEFARGRIAEAGSTVQRNVEAVLEASIADLSILSDEEYDAVLCLGGVLSYLTDQPSRRKALGELRRVAKPGAPVFVSAMNRLSGYRGAVQWPDAFDRIFPSDDGLGLLEDGTPVRELAPEEFVSELAEAGLAPERVYGSAGIAAHLPEASLVTVRQSPERWRRWHAAFLATCDHPSIVGLSPHLLAVAHRPMSAGDSGRAPRPSGS
jgi:SAM-dependent methyltransferase